MRDGGTRTQYPGKSAHDVENAASKISRLARLLDVLRWPIIICQLPEPHPPSLFQRFLELEAELNLAVGPPEEPTQPPSGG
jgi:hypothetical protein